MTNPLKMTLLSSTLMAALLSAGAQNPSAPAQATSPAQPAASAPATATNGDLAGPGDYDPNHPRVNQVNRQEQVGANRISNGIKSGKIDPAQAAQLKASEAKIQRQESADMAANHGHLTKQEQNQLNREQKRVDKQIWKDKHPKK
jgi:CRISPR/Cas system-associated endoribonuclease Cas2